MTAIYAQLAEETGWDGVFIGDAIWCGAPKVALSAAAMVTSRICLGTMVIPAPLRKPWEVAKKSPALDNLSGGRAILGLGAGAVWMGWQGFPDEVTDTRTRAEMLDESIDILILLFRRKMFDYDGKHCHVKLPLVDEMYYLLVLVQQPRIPLWCVGAWPRMKSMKRVLKCYGLWLNKMDENGKFVDLQPDDIRQMKAYFDANRTLTTSFDIVDEGSTAALDQPQTREKIKLWIEGSWGDTGEKVLERIRQRPPQED